MRTPGGRPGARGGSDTGSSLGSDTPVFSKPRAPIQAIVENDAEALAYSETHPTGEQLTATRDTWWRQARLGHRLPAEVGVIVINGIRS